MDVISRDYAKSILDWKKSVLADSMRAQLSAIEEVFGDRDKALLQLQDSQKLMTEMAKRVNEMAEKYRLLTAVIDAKNKAVNKVEELEREIKRLKEAEAVLSCSHSQTTLTMRETHQKEMSEMRESAQLKESSLRKEWHEEITTIKLEMEEKENQHKEMIKEEQDKAQQMECELRSEIESLNDKLSGVQEELTEHLYSGVRVYGAKMNNARDTFSRELQEKETLIATLKMELSKSQEALRHQKVLTVVRAHVKDTAGDVLCSSQSFQNSQKDKRQSPAIGEKDSNERPESDSSTAEIVRNNVLESDSNAERDGYEMETSQDEMNIANDWNKSSKNIRNRFTAIKSLLEKNDDVRDVASTSKEKYQPYIDEYDHVQDIYQINPRDDDNDSQETVIFQENCHVEQSASHEPEQIDVHKPYDKSINPFARKNKKRPFQFSKSNDASFKFKFIRTQSMDRRRFFDTLAYEDDETFEKEAEVNKNSVVTSGINLVTNSSEEANSANQCCDLPEIENIVWVPHNRTQPVSRGVKPHTPDYDALFDEAAETIANVNKQQSRLDENESAVAETEEDDV